METVFPLLILAKRDCLNIILVLFGLYFAVCFLLGGIFAFKIIQKLFPEQDPLVLVNSFLLYAIIGDLIFRYLMQKLPVMNIKPLLTLSIKKSKIVHFILIKSSFSFFNIIGCFFIFLLHGFNDRGYHVTRCFSMVVHHDLFESAANFLNFLINKNNIAFGALIAILLGGYLVQYFEFFD